MKPSILLLPLALLTIFTAGCLSFDYEGEAFAPSDYVTLIEKIDDLGDRGHTVIGKAMVSGDYQRFSKDRLEQKLLDEAAERGADAVVITADQVVPAGESTKVDPALRTMAATEPETNTGINQMYQDFKGGYGTVLSDRPATETVREYRRIIRADFIRFTAPETGATTDSADAVPTKNVPNDLPLNAEGSN